MKTHVSGVNSSSISRLRFLLALISVSHDLEAPLQLFSGAPSSRSHINF
jgi:hypothetical protein